MGYRNAKFGTIDGHIGVCAFGRYAFLRSARRAEDAGFGVHGIVDSLWLKKQNATIKDYKQFCKQISDDIGVGLNFEGRYKWIVFLPSKMHPNVGVLNRYYGVMENGKLKVRGVEVRKRDTPNSDALVIRQNNKSAHSIVVELKLYMANSQKSHRITIQKCCMANTEWT